MLIQGFEGKQQTSMKSDANYFFFHFKAQQLYHRLQAAL